MPDPGKEELRERFRRYRRSLDQESYEAVSRQTVSRLIGLPEIRSAGVIHVYWPMIDRRELDTRPFIHWLKEQRKEIVLPVVASFDDPAERTKHSDPRLRHVRFPGEEGLRVNRWGITEPAEQRHVPVERLEAVVVPALGAGRNGHRIGHGYGYYDEFLSKVKAPKIALVYDACLVERVPVESHDRPVDVIVTEQEVLRPPPLSEIM